MHPYIAELIGTFVLILLGGGVNANMSLKGTIGHGGGWIVIVFGWGIAVFCGVTLASPYSGAHLNPAVSLALAVAGQFAYAELFFYIFCQLVGAALGAFVVWAIYKQHFDVEENEATIFGVFSTSTPMGNKFYAFLNEFVGTFVLMLVIFYFATPSLVDEDGKAMKVGLGAIGALPVSLLVVGIGCSLGGVTGYAINPARDIGPRIMHTLLPIPSKGSSQWSYAWVPTIGPLAGGAFAALIYRLLMV